MGTASNVQLGPGKVSVAPLGSTMPTDATTALDAAFRDVGYTEGGTTLSYGITNEEVTVDQEIDPVKTATTGRSIRVRFAMAEATGKNLALALNNGANVTVSTGFEPVDANSEVHVIIVFDSDNGARYLFRQCLQAGTIEMTNAKAPAKKLIGVDFKVEKPSGAKPFKIFPAADGTI